MSRTVAILQARMGSSRLPGKVLIELAGRPMLGWAVERTRRASCVDAVVVATTLDASDDPIEQYCAAQGYACYRGSAYDVLDRYYQAALGWQAETVVRITADCPFIDPQVVDHTVAEFVRSGVDFAANRLPPPWKRTYPIGLDTEVCTFAALERAWREARLPHEREHVMPYLYTEPGRFRTLLVNTDPDYGALRWTVDTPQDLALMRQLVSFFPGRDDFSWLDVLAVVQQHPELGQLNAEVHAKVFDDVDQRFKK